MHKYIIVLRLKRYKRELVPAKELKSSFQLVTENNLMNEKYISLWFLCHRLTINLSANKTRQKRIINVVSLFNWREKYFKTIKEFALNILSLKQMMFFFLICTKIMEGSNQLLSLHPFKIITVGFNTLFFFLNYLYRE